VRLPNLQGDNKNWIVKTEEEDVAKPKEEIGTWITLNLMKIKRNFAIKPSSFFLSSFLLSSFFLPSSIDVWRQIDVKFYPNICCLRSFEHVASTRVFSLQDCSSLPGFLLCFLQFLRLKIDYLFRPPLLVAGLLQRMPLFRTLSVLSALRS
jgi:hypothetical protein